MSFAKRFRAGAVAAAALLAVLLLSSSVVLADVITTSTTQAGQTYDGTTQDFSALTNYIYVVLTSPTVSGSGLTIAGKTSGAAATDVGLSYTLSDGTITAPVTFTGSLVPNSAFVFTSSTISMSTASANAFVFSTGTFTSNTSLTFSQLTGTWPASATGSVLSATNSFGVAARSAIFVEDSTFTNVQSVLYVNPSSTYTASITDGSVVALDGVQCKSCGNAVARLLVPLTVSSNSLFRVRLCDAGAQPLISAASTVSVSGSSLLSATDSKTTGALFSVGGSVSLASGSALTVKNLTGGSTGLSSGSPIPTTSSADSTTYGDGACVFGGTAMTSAATFAANGLTVSSFEASSVCTAAKCVPGLSTGTNSTVGCECICTTGTYQPFCTYMSDPIASKDDGSGSCTLFKCTQCSTTDVSKCLACETNYKIVSGACVRECTDPNCATCGTDGVCSVCNTGYKLQSDKSCLLCNIANCATCSAANKCSSCNPNYSLYNNACVACGIANCASCQSGGVCAACASGYSLNSDGTACVQCNVAHCTHCTTANKCDTCDTSSTRYTLTSSGTCVSCTVPNCQTCETAGVCSVCAAGKYTLTNGKCIACNVNRCTACSSDNFCSTCESGFRLSSTGQCYVCPASCTTCSADNVCNTCGADYSLVGTTCVECKVTNCLQCNTANVCASCSAGRVPDSTGACVLEVACQTGYYKDTDGTCKPNCNIASCTACSAPNVCSACEGSLTLSSDRKSCVCPTSQCATCSAVRCLSCLPGYKLTSGFLCVRDVSAAAAPLGVFAALLSFLVAVLAVMSL